MAIARAPREHQPKVPDVEICAPEDIEELRHIARAYGRHHGSAPPYDGYTRNIMRAHRLVRQGFLRRERHSDQEQRGERRFYWWAFYLTEKGRKFL